MIPRRLRGFTLAEFFAVMAIVAILAAFLGTVLVGARERGTMAMDVSNLRQIGAAGAMYAADYDDKFPLSVRPLLSEGRITQDVCRSPADPYERGFLLAWILDVPQARLVVRDPIPFCTYVGPADGLWDWHVFSHTILPGRNPGWLVNLARARVDESGPLDVRGPYQRLMMDGSVEVRTTGKQSLWLHGGQQKGTGHFGSYFCDEDAEWFKR